MWVNAFGFSYTFVKSGLASFSLICSGVSSMVDRPSSWSWLSLIILRPGIIISISLVV